MRQNEPALWTEIVAADTPLVKQLDGGMREDDVDNFLVDLQVNEADIEVVAERIAKSLPSHYQV